MYSVHLVNWYYTFTFESITETFAKQRFYVFRLVTKCNPGLNNAYFGGIKPRLVFLALSRMI